jgi:hypothetical protein
MGIKCVEVTIGKFSPLDIWHVKKVMIVEGIIKYIKDLPRLYIFVHVENVMFTHHYFNTNESY